MKSYDIVGYAHSDGYCLCINHALHGKLSDEGNESGYVQPIFAGDEFDFTPTCDVPGCTEEIAATVLGS